MRRVSDNIASLIVPVVEGLNFEYVGATYGQAERGMTLCVYIDHENGINVEDCATVSRQLSAVLDVEDPISGEYILEVSSPGTDRPLFTLAHFSSCIDSQIKLRSSGVSTLGRRSFRGKLVEVADEHIVVEVDGIDHTIAFSDIERANVIAEH